MSGQNYRNEMVPEIPRCWDFLSDEVFGVDGFGVDEVVQNGING